MSLGWGGIAAAIAPSGGLCWGLCFGRMGPAAGTAGALAGVAIGVLGGWLLARQADRAETGGSRWFRWLAPFGTLVLLFVALVVIPAFLRVGQDRGLPPVW